MNPFTSRSQAVRPHTSGWTKLPSGVQITNLPLWDADEGIFARIGHGQAASHLSKYGWRLPTVNELDELHSATKAHISPVTLPTSFQVKGLNSGAIDTFREDHMRSLEWCQLHDRTVFERMKVAGWNGGPVSNAGKHWASGGIIYGWWNKDDTRIQNASKAHLNESGYTDYATTTHAVHDLTEAFTWADGLNLSGLSVGLRALSWAGFQSQLGIQEISGAKHNPNILRYSRFCRRDGTLLGVDQWGQPIWEGGNPLPLSRDEDPWCAAFVSESLRCSLLPGETPPHGLRVSVREIAADATIEGSLMSNTILPQPGWLALYGRLGENPLNGGRGHVRLVVQLDGADKYLGIGGNEGDTIKTETHTMGQEVAWIAR